MRIGIHLPNDGEIRPHRWRQVERFRLLKALVRLDTDDPLNYEALAANAHPDAQFILRLYWPGFWAPNDVIAEASARLPSLLSLLGGSRCLIELGNEPNHRDGIEGFGSSEAKLAEYKIWYRELLEGLRDEGFGGLGFPGLAVGDHNHNESAWRLALHEEMELSDWVGCHCYWQTIDQMRDSCLGENWQWYVNHVLRPVYVTEAGNSACHSPHLPQPKATAQGQQYMAWAGHAAEGGVAGVAFFILDGTPDWAGFRLSDYALDNLSKL